MQSIQAGALIAVLFLAGCGESIDPNEPQGFIQTKGSDTMVNAIQMVTEEFMKDYPHVLAVTGGGGDVGTPRSSMNLRRRHRFPRDEARGNQIAEGRQSQNSRRLTASPSSSIGSNPRKLTIEDPHI
jgi:hypothetical protein